MKILHTSDWHLGKRLEDVSRLEEQRAVLAEIIDIARREQVDAVVVAGDLFDTFNPPTEAVELLYGMLKRLTDNGRCPVIALAGNHDSPDRIEAPDPLARECGIIFAGYPDSVIPSFELETGLKVLNSEPGFLELALPGTEVPLRLLLTPYANEFRMKTCLENTGSETIPENENTDRKKQDGSDLEGNDSTGISNPEGLLLPQSELQSESEFEPEPGQEQVPEADSSATGEDRDATLRGLLQQKWQELADRHCDDKGVNLLVSHLFVNRKGADLPEEPEEEKPILHVGGASVVYTENVPVAVQYVALGHLHRMQAVDVQPCPVYYSGSPLSYSFAEANQQKYVLIIDVEPGATSRVREIPLTQGRKLLRKRAEGMEEALQWLSEHTDALVELTLVTDTYLTAADRRRLNAVHSGIISVIPEVTGAAALTAARQKTIDLSGSMEDLFRDYFRHEKGQDPNEEIMKLFTEMMAEEDEP